MVVLTDKFDSNLSNANFCNFFDNIQQILRVKASCYIIIKDLEWGRLILLDTDNGLRNKVIESCSFLYNV